jgi:hypothetical protein
MDKSKEITEALAKQIPRPPVINELGGGIYYTCYWIYCGESLKRWYDYCPHCGQRILWEGETD